MHFQQVDIFRQTMLTMQQPQSSPVDLMIAQKQQILFVKSIRYSFLALYYTDYSRVGCNHLLAQPDPHLLLKLSIFFFFSFCIQLLRQQEEYKTANVTLTREMLTTKGLLLHWVMLWVFCKEACFWSWHRERRS